MPRTSWMHLSLALTVALGMTACSSNGGTSPSLRTHSAVRGQVQQTGPEPTASRIGAYPIAAASVAATTASTVTVAEVASDGSLDAVAQGKVRTDGSFVVTGVPAGRSDLVVDVQSSGGAHVGRAMVYGTTSAGDTLTAAPIDDGTTVRGLVWSDLEANGDAGLTSPAEVALFVNAGPTASASILANDEIHATAQGVATASDAMTQVFSGAGAALSASARAALMGSAAADFADSRFRGISSDSAHAALVQAALAAYGKAGVSGEALVMASAAAASTMDAQLDGATTSRGELDAEAVWMNLAARERLAASFQSSAEAAVADSIMDVLSATTVSVREDSTAAEIETAIATDETTADSATTHAMLNLLVPNASAIVRGSVQAAIQSALTAASLSARLSTATTASAAAQAIATYQAGVQAAVQAMLTAAGRTDLSAAALTSLCIAAEGSAYIRAS